MRTAFRLAARGRYRASEATIALALLAGALGGSAAARAEPAGANSADAPAAPADGAAPPADASATDIVVTGQQSKQTVTAGALGTRPLLDTPFSVSAVDVSQIQRLAATTIDAAFNYDAGVRVNNSGVASGNTFSIRGIAIDRTNGYKVDGLAWPYWFQDHPIEHLEQIQILKGAGGFAYGFAAPGGVVNLISKQPTTEFQALFNVSYRTDSILREHLDIGGPLDRDGNIGFRFNAVNEEGNLYNGAYNKDQFASLALDDKLTDRLTLKLDGFYQRTRQDNQVNTISFTTTPTKVNGVTYGPVTSLTPTGGELEPGARGTSKLNDIDSLTGRLNYQISKDWNATVAARYASLDERFPGSLATIYDNAGDYYSTVYNMNRLFKYYVADAGINGKFETGPIRHEIVGGLSSITVQFDYDNPTRNFVLGPDNNAGSPTLNASNAYVFNIYNSNSTPTVVGNPAALYNNRSPIWTLYQEIHQRSAFASDTASLGPVSILLGLRYTDYQEINYNPNESLTSYFRYHPVLPVISASLDLLPSVRAYVTYVDALQRGGIAPASATNPNASFGPLKTTQYEAGVKAEGRWGNASVALFRISTPSEYVDSTDTFVRNGDARYQGIEVNAGLTPIDGVFLGGSLAYLDARQISGPTALIGQHIAGTTGFQVSVLTEVAVPLVPGLKVNAGIRHSGDSYGAGQLFVLPGSTVGDLGASYGFRVSDHGVVLRANVQNLTDERYWIPGATGTSLSAGQPRTFTVSAQVALQGDHHDAPVGAAGQNGGVGADVGPAYIGIDFGAALPTTFHATAVNQVNNPSAASAGNALTIDQKAGWDIDGVLGYNLGLFSAEVEAGFKRYGVGAIAVNNASVVVDPEGRGVGTYADAGGRTGVLSVLFNGLFNIGASTSPWHGFVGGGAGLARVSTGQWTLDRTRPALTFPAPQVAAAASPTYFSDDNATAFAYQGIAGVRRAITDRIDLTLKYRYFAVPNLDLRTTSGNAIEGNLRSHSLLVGATFHL